MNNGKNAKLLASSSLNYGQVCRVRQGDEKVLFKNAIVKTEPEVSSPWKTPRKQPVDILSACDHGFMLIQDIPQILNISLSKVSLCPYDKIILDLTPNYFAVKDGGLWIR